jgi:hypothetical protein
VLFEVLQIWKDDEAGEENNQPSVVMTDPTIFPTGATCACSAMDREAQSSPFPKKQNNQNIFFVGKLGFYPGNRFFGLKVETIVWHHGRQDYSKHQKTRWNLEKRN